MSTTLVSAPADERRLRDLRRMKSFAFALLVLAAVVYAATVGYGGGVAYVNATAEAAMVGALADWFAVTALFRHPLGIPVPHTAIIPTRKDALGRSLEEFVATNFLAEDVVRAKVARAQVAARAGAWLAERSHSERASAELGGLVARLLRSLRDEDVAVILDHAVVRPLAQRPWSPPAGRLLSRVVTDGAHHRFVDLGAEHLHAWLRDNQSLVFTLVLERAPAWTPRWVDERIAVKIYSELVALTADIAGQRDHRARLALDDLLLRLARDLQEDPATMLRAERFVERLVTHPDVRASIADVWASVRTLLVESAVDPDSELRQRSVVALQAFGVQLGQDPALRQRVDTWVEDIVGFLVRTYRDEVSTVISDTVQRWDATDAARRIELHVGRDLQFIRVNGTVVGGLAGLLIHALTVLAG